MQGRFQKKIKGSSFVGVAATPLKPLPSCYSRRDRVLLCRLLYPLFYLEHYSYRVLDMHVKFAKQFTHYLILFQELEGHKNFFEF